MHNFQLDNQKIFIAGASGMVGSSIRRTLLNSKNKILSENIFAPNKQELDLCNFKDVEEWFKKNKPSVVIIASAKVGGILANSNQPYEFILENSKMQNNLIEISWKFNVKKLLFLGSSCIYPKFANQPIKEEYLLSGPLERTNEFYAIAKIGGIKLCEALRIQYGFNAICLMPTNLYGQGDYYNPTNGHVIPSLIRKFSEAKDNKKSEVICLGTGNALREFLYVDDLAEACIFALKNWEPLSNEAPKNDEGNNLSWLNVGSDFEISIRDLAKKIGSYIGYEGNIIWDNSKPDGTTRKKLDTSRLGKLGWKSKTSIDKGLLITIEHYKNEIFENKLRI